MQHAAHIDGAGGRAICRNVAAHYSDDGASSTIAERPTPPSTRTSQRRHVASLEHDKIEWAFGWIFTDVTSDQCPAKIRQGRVRSVENKRQVRSAPPVAKTRPPPNESEDVGEWTDQHASACAA